MTVELEILPLRDPLDARILIMSDTHGWLRPELRVLAAEADWVLHAGDFGEGVWEDLAAAGHLIGVRGNTDDLPPASRLPLARLLSIAGRRVWLLHDRQSLDFSGERERADWIVHGHTHRAEIERRGDRLILNPGPAGRQRVREGASCLILRISAEGVKAEIHPLSS